MTRFSPLPETDAQAERSRLADEALARAPGDVEGERERALELLRELVTDPNWTRLDHVAAEADLERYGSARSAPVSMRSMT